jgi:putative endonuclease
MQVSKKTKWYQWEQLVIDYFLQEGFSLVEKNYTIVGGELDVIMKNDLTRLFVEVKVVDSITNLGDFIGKRKISSLQKTIYHFLNEQAVSALEVQLAIVFIHWGTLYHIYYYEN